MDTTYHNSEEVVTEAAFVKMILPGLTILVKCGLEGEHHAIQKLVKTKGMVGWSSRRSQKTRIGQSAGPRSSMHQNDNQAHARKC
jgi:hypothetical protein